MDKPAVERVMTEPAIIAQNADGLTGSAALAWFSGEALHAKEVGMTHARYAVHPAHGWLLFEAWERPPVLDGELVEGEPRWQITDEWTGCTHLDCLPECTATSDGGHCERWARFTKLSK